ncbi:MAG: D-alanyl-D-alanine carboxypeptidase [Lachnospiraceae bacterium]|nr:D-alanyl-D-alanine carboxypeptidase [Lachnospiraceae bacterium]
MKKTVYLLPFLLFFLLSLPVHATQEELDREAEERKSQPVQSNEIEGWPQGPALGAEGAALMDADSGTFLYAKNIDEELFPASTTKLMCCLLAVENCSLNEEITVYQSAINANEPDGSHMGLRAGEKFTLEELLYGIIINSANEACNVVAEHIAGSMDAYVEMMNQRAMELGCTHTHFVTTNGLHSEDHYTSAHDLALIARAFFSHEILCTIARTPRYVIEENDSHTEHSLRSKNKLYPGQEYAYADLLGSKTGFTSKSRQALVSCAQKGEMRLICVILKEETPAQYTDTLALFEYGFSHFSKGGAEELEDRFAIRDPEFFGSESLFGSTGSLMEIDRGSHILLPEGITAGMLDTNISYEALPKDTVARIDYSYHGVTLGSTAVRLNSKVISQDLSSINVLATMTDGKTYINIYHVLTVLLLSGLGFVLLTLLWRLFRLASSRAGKMSRIRKHRGEMIKSRSTLRKSFQRHSTSPVKRPSARKDEAFSPQSERSRRSVQRNRAEQLEARRRTHRQIVNSQRQEQETKRAALKRKPVKPHRSREIFRDR